MKFMQYGFTDDTVCTNTLRAWSCIPSCILSLSANGMNQTKVGLDKFFLKPLR
jgi:hypothetical protein